jgi:hypothetical protein
MSLHPHDLERGVEEKGMKNLTQFFLDLARIKQDGWECYPGFIALKSKQSLDPQ